MGRAAAVIPAAGSSCRMGGINKVLFDLAGRSVLSRSVSAAVASPEVGEVFVCVPVGHEDDYRQALGPMANRVLVMVGGRTRQDTVRLGLEAAVRTGCDRVIIHDGARPLATPELFSRVLAGLAHADACVPAIAATDTVKRGADGFVTATVDRGGLFLVQTPQAFRLGVLLSAHRLAGERGWIATDDAGLVELSGGRVAIIEGEAENIKLTTTGDLDVAARLISRAIDTRVGLGFDIHKLVPGRRLVLGGVLIEHELGLYGHSDADVVAHAVMDAVLGAVGLPDIGQQFPNDDERYRDADSMVLLKQVRELAATNGYRVASVDVSVVADQPRLGPWVTEMKRRLGQALDVEPSRVGIKATTTEGVGHWNENPGVMAWAVVVIVGG